MKILRNVDRVLYGPGAFDKLGDLLEPIRSRNAGYFIFLVDDYFADNPLCDRLPSTPQDVIELVYAGGEEPKTSQIDAWRDKFLAEKGLAAGVIGIGGGSVMDLAKALALMLTNDGSSQLYQGLNLIKKPGVYHCGVPTIAGTGAECSSTAVLTGPEKKLGLKCEWTVFDQIVLDPLLLASVPKEQWFYTGMDSYIHCIESETGTNTNAFSRAYGDQSLALCREVFLGEKAGQTPENDEKLMLASLFGGLSLTYSEVGICHALSYGLSFELGTRHGYANCLAFNVLGEYYPQGVAEFHQMLSRFSIDLPKNLSQDWSDAAIGRMAQIAYNLDHMWTHALGTDWKNKITLADIEQLYRRL